MKNLLFLAGLIMVTAACSSGTSGTNMTTSENDKDANISFVYLGVSKKMYGELLYSLCQASYNDYTKELCLEITGNEDASLTYSLSEIKEEYIDKAKKNKVSVIYEGNKFYPVVLKKDTDNTPRNLWGGRGELRKFQYTCILKDFDLTGELSYDLLYHGAFLNGCTKVGNQMIKKGRYFFAENDFMPEITSVDVFGQKGTFSAGLSIFDSPSSNDFFVEDRFGTYQYALVQVLYENDELIIRVDDGKTFRYPAIYLQPGQQEILKKGTQPLSSINGYIISAVQISNGNWIPVTISKYEKEYRYVYYLWNSDQHYPVIFRRIYDLNIYFDFMQYYGVNDFLGFELQDIAFYNKAAN